MHPHDAADALPLPRGRVVNSTSLLQPAGVDTQKDQLSEEGIHRHLEGQGGKGLLGVAVALQDLLGIAGLRPMDGRQVDGAGQIVDHRVQHQLDALVLESGAAEHRHGLEGYGRLAQHLPDQLGTDLLPLEVEGHHIVAEVGERLDDGVPPRLGGHGQLRGDRRHAGRLPQLAAEHHGLLLDQVHDPGEIVLGPDRHLNGDGTGPETLANRRDHRVEVRADTVHLVDERHARDMILVRLPPDRLGLGLHPAHGTKDGNRPVEHSHGTFHLDRKVHVTGRINKIDGVILPDAGRGRGRDRDAALALLLHPVHGGRALVDLADLVAAPRIVQDALAGRRLPRVDVGRYSYVSELCNVQKTHLPKHGTPNTRVGPESSPPDSDDTPTFGTQPQK